MEKQRTREELKIYMECENLLIQYMLLRGVIKDENDFIKRFAPLYEMIAEGSIQVPTESLDELTDKMRNQLNQVYDRALGENQD